MNVPVNHIQIQHGSLTLNVPRNIFRGPEAELVEDRAEEFKKSVMRRYPWISENSAEVIMRRAREEMLRVIDEETGGRSKSRVLASKGNVDEAIRHIKEHLEKDPNDAASWYTLGELLCSEGDAQEGYKAFNRGRSLK